MHCACQEEIKRLEDEKEDILDALLLARDMLGNFYTCDSVPITMIDRAIERYTENKKTAV